MLEKLPYDLIEFICLQGEGEVYQIVIAAIPGLRLPYVQKKRQMMLKDRLNIDILKENYECFGYDHELSSRDLEYMDTFATNKRPRYFPSGIPPSYSKASDYFYHIRPFQSKITNMSLNQLRKGLRRFQMQRLIYGRYFSKDYITWHFDRFGYQKMIEEEIKNRKGKAWPY